jgi:saccharopine dehydrogenase-like NADP-dependent oxidoreductase
MKAIIFGGGGDMGVAMAYGLHRLGIGVQIVDNNGSSRNNAYKILKETKLVPNVEIRSGPDFTNANVAISAAPYAVNEKIAGMCFRANVPYCDLGGNPLVSSNIQELAVRNKGVAFTDLGCAPGLVNIMAEASWKHHRKPRKVPKNVYMMVGGLPNNPTNRLRYARVFNVGGLYNELTGDCEILEDGKVVTRPALGDIETVADLSDPLVSFESGLTKGGLSHTLKLMESRKVKNCCYKTLRFPGHFDYITFMLEECKMNFKEFVKFIKRACPETEDDFLIMHIEVDDHVVQHRIDSDDTWTAMQKSTSFPTAAMAAILAEGDGRKPVLDYSDVPLVDFAEKLSVIGGIGEPLSYWNL